MAVEIKSVRVRKSNTNSGTLDIRVAIYEDNQSRNEEGKLVFNNRVLIGFDNSNKIVWTKTNYSKLLTTKYKDFTDEQFIKEFIDMNSKMDGGGNEYKIIQDPWKDNVPIIRNYGFDPYYLNNGAEVYISWTDVDSRISEGGEKYSKSDGTEITYDPTFYRETGNVKPLNITKSIRIVHKEETQNLTLNKNNEFEYTIYSNDYRGSDLIVLDILISKWKNKIPNYDLAVCSPNNESCSIISYKSPLKPFVADPEPTSVTKVATNETPKEKINVVLPTTPIKTKIDTLIKVYIGKPNEIKDVNTNNVEDNFEGLSDEYTETNFEGMDEVEYNIQEQVADNQEDSDSEMGTVGAPANIRPVNGLDDLLKLAGECARELGKNPKVKYENLKKGYTKGIHGLCPQGTLSVLYALTGIKKIGMTRGNAETFSFRGNSVLGENYFENKVKVGKSYFDQLANWQIGDVIAVGYTGGKKYGHIQVWTGINWMSDFKQNGLQRNHVDWDTVALWRANSKGISAINKQSGQSV